jgi:Glycosyl transferases group 1
VALSVFDNGVPIGQVLANRYRAGLEKPGVRNGRQAFKLSIPGGLSPAIRHVIQVKRTRDGADIPGSPVAIEPSGSFDDEMEQMVAGAIAALDDNDARARALSFLIGQTDRLLQLRAEGQRAERFAHKLFRRRWGPKAAAMSDVADPGRRALVIDNRVPVRARDTGSHVILSHMEALRGLGYRVSLAAGDEMDLTGPTAGALADDGITVCGTPFYGSVEDVLRRQADCFDVVYLHGPENAARYLELARKYNPRARILYSVADLHHLRLERQAKIESRPELMASAERLRMIEYMAAWRADAVVTHSTHEALVLRRAIPKARVNVVTWALEPRPTAVPFAARKGVAFVGGFGHRPSPDAAHWLVEAVMPLVWQADPRIPCLLAGADMPESLSRLAGDRVFVLGHVADLATGVFDRVRLTAAPLRFGAGVEGKMVESLAAGVPCVMSPVAAEGLALPPALNAMVGESAAAVAGLICRLHGDETANRTATEAGLDFIRRDFSADATLSALKSAIDGEEPADQEARPVSVTA